MPITLDPRLAGLFASRIASIRPVRRGPVVLYGKGNLGQLARSWCDYNGVGIKANLDCNDKPWPDELEGYPILVATVSEPFSQIRNELTMRALNPQIIPFYDYVEQFKTAHPLGNGWVSGRLDEKDRQQISHVFENLKDDESQQDYLRFLYWRISRIDHKPERSACREERYFIAPMMEACSDKEAYLDVGAHLGNTYKRLKELLGERLRAALLVEPDTASFPVCNRLASTRVELLKKAVTCSSDKRGFAHGFGYASKLDPSAKGRADCVRMDELGFLPTFVKVHTEGDELSVLSGGRGLLEKQRPKIAVTCYHSRDGLWKLQKQLMDTLTAYDWHFRVHSWCGTGAVIYGVPQK